MSHATQCVFLFPFSAPHQYLMIIFVNSLHNPKDSLNTLMTYTGIAWAMDFIHYRKICLSRVNPSLPCASRFTEHGKEFFAVGARKRSRQRKPHGRSDAERTAKKPARQNKQKAHGKRKPLGKDSFAVRRASLHGKPVDQDLPRFPNISREKNSRRAANSRALKQFAGNTMPCG